MVDTLDASGENWVRVCRTEYIDGKIKPTKLEFKTYEDAIDQVYKQDDLCRIVEIKYHYVPLKEQTREID